MTTVATPINVLTTQEDKTIFQDISNELNLNARMKYSKAFNEKNTLNDWLAFTNKFIGRAGDPKRTPKQVRMDLVKAAGLLVSTIQALDGNNVAPRHFENSPNNDPTGEF